MSQRTLWRLTVAAVVLLSVITFTPLVLPLGSYQPWVLGMPYTLWTGILVTVAFVGLTYVATQVYPPNNEKQDT
ncbi:MAG: hypothetical protein ABEL51_08605 [Salinibacter sp.]